MSRHPLADLIIDAAAGRYPAADGGWHRVPPWRPGLQAVIAFSAHAVLVLDDAVPDATLTELGVDGLGGAHDPRVICALSGPGGWIDTLDLIMVGRGTGAAGPAALVPRPDLAGHPRARIAARIRSRSRVFGYDDAGGTVVILAEGLAALTELSFELDPEQRGAGRGTALVRAALQLVPAGDLVLASVAPGHPASLRSLLGAGFVPVGSVQLFGDPDPDLAGSGPADPVP